MAKLTKFQWSVLDAAIANAPFGIDYPAAVAAGGSGRTLKALERQGYLTSRQFANKKVWEVTDAGLLAGLEEFDV